MIVIFLCNSLITIRLQQSTKRHRLITSRDEAMHRRESAQRNVTITLLAVSFAFLVLHMPLAVYNCFSLSRAEMNNQEECNDSRTSKQSEFLSIISNWEAISASHFQHLLSMSEIIRKAVKNCRKSFSYMI